MKKPIIFLLHAGYWFMFCFLLFVFFRLSMAYQSRNTPIHFWTRLMLGFAIIPGLFSFYVSYTFLFTAFLARKKFLLLVFAGIGLSLLAALLGGLSLSYIFFDTGIMFRGGINSAIAEIEVMGFGAIMNAIIALVMRGFISWYGDIRVKEQLNQKNHEMEMDLVRSRIHPHFLFNTLNNIDVLIEKDAAKASRYLNELSDIMRFVLYETDATYIPLKRELDYIEKYVALQRIRTSNPGFVNYLAEGDPANWEIAPMIFIPFIENAFKHAGNKKVEDAIFVRLKIEENKICFTCNNAKAGPATLNHNGLGNELIQKRLQLLYPDKFKLEISEDDSRYKINLTLVRNAY